MCITTVVIDMCSTAVAKLCITSVVVAMCIYNCCHSYMFNSILKLILRAASYLYQKLTSAISNLC